MTTSAFAFWIYTPDISTSGCLFALGVNIVNDFDSKLQLSANNDVLTLNVLDDSDSGEMVSLPSALMGGWNMVSFDLNSGSLFSWPNFASAVTQTLTFTRTLAFDRGSLGSDVDMTLLTPIQLTN